MFHDGGGLNRDWSAVRDAEHLVQRRLGDFQDVLLAVAENVARGNERRAVSIEPEPFSRPLYDRVADMPAVPGKGPAIELRHLVKREVDNRHRRQLHILRSRRPVCPRLPRGGGFLPPLRLGIGGPRQEYRAGHPGILPLDTRPVLGYSGVRRWRSIRATNAGRVTASRGCCAIVLFCHFYGLWGEVIQPISSAGFFILHTNTHINQIWNSVDIYRGHEMVIPGNLRPPAPVSFAAEIHAVLGNAL